MCAGDQHCDKHVNLLWISHLCVRVNSSLYSWWFDFLLNIFIRQFWNSSFHSWIDFLLSTSRITNHLLFLVRLLIINENFLCQTVKLVLVRSTINCQRKLSLSNCQTCSRSFNNQLSSLFLPTLWLSFWFDFLFYRAQIWFCSVSTSYWEFRHEPSSRIRSYM